MMIWALVPAKPLDKGKSRLREFFSSDDLAAINKTLLTHCLDTLAECPYVTGTLVVSRDPHVLEIAAEHGAESLLEAAPYSLIHAVTQGIEQLASRNQPIIVVPTDLPAMTARDLEGWLSKVPKDGVSIIPDMHQTGTNAIYMSQAGMLKPRFGTNSFQKHCLQAWKKDLELLIYLNKSIQHDLDTAADLTLLETLSASSPNYLQQERIFTS